MKIIIPGGSGQVGTLLARAFQRDGHDVVVLSRTLAQAPWRVVKWDAATLGEWAGEIDGADLRTRAWTCPSVEMDLTPR